MSAADSHAAIELLAEKRREMADAEDFAAYAFLVLGILGYQAPDVLRFILARADERLESGGASPGVVWAFCVLAAACVVLAGVR